MPVHHECYQHQRGCSTCTACAQVTGRQWAYLSLLPDLADFEAHTKDRHECSFYKDKMDSHKGLTWAWAGVCLAHSKETVQSTPRKSLNMLSWKGPIRIIQSSSWPCLHSMPQSQSCPKTWEFCSQIKVCDWGVLTTRRPVTACGVPKSDEDLKGICINTSISQHSHSGS